MLAGMHSRYENVNPITMGHSILPVTSIFVTKNLQSFSNNYCNNYGTACGPNVSHKMQPRCMSSSDFYVWDLGLEHFFCVFYLPNHANIHTVLEYQFKTELYFLNSSIITNFYLYMFFQKNSSQWTIGEHVTKIV